MDPVLAAAVFAAAAAIVGAGFGLRGTVLVERTKTTALNNTNAMETVKVQIDGWDRLTDSYRHEISRLTNALTEERVVAEAFAKRTAQLEHDLRAALHDVEFCRTHHQGDMS